MPTYDYKCLDCGHSFEAFQKINDASLEICPRCKGKLKRLIGAGGGLIFKGSGFYATDYKKTSKKAFAEKGRGKDKSQASSQVSNGCSCCKEDCPQAKSKNSE